jgi:pimeloyl-ACP methyl ester carboxylesterase
MDLRQRLASVTARSLVVAGAEDPATPPSHGARIAASIYRARLLVVRGAAHLANVSSPEHVTAALIGQLLGANGSPQ